MPRLGKVDRERGQEDARRGGGKRPHREQRVRFRHVFDLDAHDNIVGSVDRIADRAQSEMARPWAVTPRSYKHSIREPDRATRVEDGPRFGRSDDDVRDQAEPSEPEIVSLVRCWTAMMLVVFGPVDVAGIDPGRDVLTGLRRVAVLGRGIGFAPDETSSAIVCRWPTLMNPKRSSRASESCNRHAGTRDQRGCAGVAAPSS